MRSSVGGSSKRPPVLILVAVASIAAALGLGTQSSPSPAAADHWRFSAYWSSSPAIRRGSQSGLSLSNATFDTAAIYGGDAWDNAPNAIGADSPNIGWAGTSTSAVTGCTSASTGEIFIGSGAVSGTALTSLCYSGSSMTKATIRISTNVSWANGAVSGKYDIQSTFTHEMGHAMGWGGTTHITSPCTGSGIATMCEAAVLNSTAKRTLTSADTDVFDAAYD